MAGFLIALMLAIAAGGLLSGANGASPTVDQPGPQVPTCPTTKPNCAPGP